MLKRRLLISSGNGPTKLSPPTFSPTPGYSTGSNVRITLTNPNPSGSSIIKYTTDGTEPTATNGTTYSASVNISAPGGVIYAVCVPSTSTSAYTISDVAGGEYVIANKNVNPPRITPADGTYTNAITVDMAHENDPLIPIYYSYGEFSDPINNGTLFNGSFSLSTSGDYFIKAICKDSGNISTATYANYTLNITSPTLPEPFRDASLIVRMYLTNEGPSQILSAEYDYTNWGSQDIRVSISDGTNGNIIEYNNYTQIGAGSTWDGTYTVPSTGYYFVAVTLPSYYIPSCLFKGTSVTEIEYISADITKIGDPTPPNVTSVEDECGLNQASFPLDQSGNPFMYGAFSESSLRTIILDSVVHTTLSTVLSGRSLQVIGAASFYECNNVIELSLPKSVEYICSHAFLGIGKFEDTLREIYLPENLIRLGYRAFMYCHYVQDYHLENCKYLTHIYSHAFCANLSLATITIPPLVTDISERAFSSMINPEASPFDCCRLVEVINKSNLNLSPNTNHNSGIGKYCISYKTSGTSDLNPRIIVDGYKILIYNNIKYLVHIIPEYNSQGHLILPTESVAGNYVLNTAFLVNAGNNWGLTNWITAVEINSGVTEIKDFAFLNAWYMIKTIYVLPDVTAVPTISANSFEEIGNYGTLHVWYQTTGASAWMSNNPNYLGYKHWTLNEYGP